MLFALPLTPDTRNIAEDISEPTPEDVAFIAWHPQRFLDGIREAIACKSEVFEHGGVRFYGATNSRELGIPIHIVMGAIVPKHQAIISNFTTDPNTLSYAERADTF